MIVLVLGSSSTYSPHINHSGQDSLTKIYFRAPIFRFGLEAPSNKNSNANPVGTKCRLQTADRVRNADCRLGTKCRLQTGYKMHNENLYFFLGPERSGVYTHWFAHMCLILLLAYMRNRPTNTHTHTNKKDTACLITSAHSTSSQHNLFSNSHHDECTSFPNTQLRKNKIKFNPKVLKVHIKRI